jgi:hypothetical protein
MWVQIRIQLFYFNVDSDPAPNQSDANLRPMVYIPSGLHFEPLKLLTLTFNADPDLGFPSNADPDPQPWVKVSRTRRRCNFPKIPPCPPPHLPICLSKSHFTHQRPVHFGP